MSTPKKTTAPAIEELKLSELIVDIALSGRSEKEITANAKLLSPMMAAHGSWDATQPGQYFIRDGKKHLAAGFTRHAAAKLANIKTGCFVQTEDNPEKLRTACIRTNLGKPISAFEQGRIYAAMRDGSDVSTLKEGDIALSAMTEKEIAAEVGYTPVHIANCLAIFESSPEIAELIEAGKVSAGIVVRSKQLVKDEGKQLKFLKAAIKAAESEGKDCATQKHLDAVRGEYAPIKVAEQGKPAKDKKPASKVDGNEETTEEAGEDSTTATEVEQPSLGDLGTSAPTSKPNAAHKITDAAIRTVLSQWCDDCTLSASDEDLDSGVEKIKELLSPM